jgi:hypothetical protein
MLAGKVRTPLATSARSASMASKHQSDRCRPISRSTHKPRRGPLGWSAIYDEVPRALELEEPFDIESWP